MVILSTYTTWKSHFLQCHYNRKSWIFPKPSQHSWQIASVSVPPLCTCTIWLGKFCYLGLPHQLLSTRCLQHPQHWDNQKHPHFSQLRETARLQLGSPSQNITAWALSQCSKLGLSQGSYFSGITALYCLLSWKPLFHFFPPVFYMFQAKQQSVIVF